MDTQKAGSFLKELRKEKGLTQEQLGERIGVTNKTVSRWENGNYMPPVECLVLLSELYGVSINEIVSGKRLDGEKFADAAENNLKGALERGERSYRKSEKMLLLMLAASTVIAMVTIHLLPIDKTDPARGLLLIFLVVALTFISNTVNLVALLALAMNKDRVGIR